MQKDSRINSLTVQKGLCCITVFFCHFLGLTGTFSISILDDLILNDGILSVLNCGNLAVDIFMVISGYLAAKKAFTSDVINWTNEVVKRYLRLTVAVGCTAFYSVLFLKLKLFCHYDIGYARNDPWLYQSHWGTPVGWRYAVKAAIYGILFDGDMKCYPAFWMMKYMFTGVILALLMSCVIKNLNHVGKMLLLTFLIVVFAVFSDPYYLCFVWGVLLVYLEDSVLNKYICKIGLLIYFGGWFLGNYGLQLSVDPLKTIVRSISAMLIVKGFMVIYGYVEARGDWKNGIVHKILVGLGKISFGVFCTHLIVMCTFASWWYQKFEGASKYLQCGLDLVISVIITLIVSVLFYIFIEGKLFDLVWKLVNKYLFRKSI